MAATPRIPKLKKVKKKRIVFIVAIITVVVVLAAAFFLNLLPNPGSLATLFEPKESAMAAVPLADSTAPLNFQMSKPLVADFYSSPEGQNTSFTLQFFDLSRGLPESWVWDFGDTTNSTLQHPVHQYTRSGVYNVSLTVTRGDGSKRTFTRNDILNAGQPPSRTILLDTLRQGRIAKGSEVTFRTTAPNSYITIDGVSNQIPEGAVVKIRAGSDTEGKMVIRNGQLFSFQFSDVTLYINGMQVAQGTSDNVILPSYSYFQTNLTYFVGPATGTIRQLVVDGNILRSGVENSRILITYRSGTIGKDPTIITNPAFYEGTATAFAISDAVIADFEPNSEFTGPAPLTIAFQDTSAGSPDRWLWDFGDKTQSGDQNPVHVYSVPGSYTVTLAVSRGDQKDSVTRRNIIIASPPGVIANFSATPLKGPASLTVRFSDRSLNAPSSWFWTFGEYAAPSASREQNPTVTYSEPGTYMVSLTAGNIYGSNDITRPAYITVTDPFKNPDKPLLVRTGKQGHVEKDSVVEFVVSDRPASISINGTFHQLKQGSVIKLVARSDQQGEIYIVGGDIIKFSFPDMALYVNSDLVEEGAINSIYVPGYSGFKTALSYYLEPDSAFTYFAVGGYDVLSDLDNAWIRISNLGTNPSGSLRLISSSNSTYIEGAMYDSVHDWIIA